MSSLSNSPLCTPTKASFTVPRESPTSARLRTRSSASKSSARPSLHHRALSLGGTRRPSLEVATPPPVVPSPRRYRGRRSSSVDFDLADPALTFKTCHAGASTASFKPFYESPVKTSAPPLPMHTPTEGGKKVMTPDMRAKLETAFPPRGSSLSASSSASSVDSHETTTGISSRPESSSSLATTLNTVPEDDLIPRGHTQECSDASIDQPPVERPSSPYLALPGKQGFELSIESVVVSKAVPKQKKKGFMARLKSKLGRIFGRKKVRV